MEEYRSRDEVSEWRDHRDPITLFASYLKERQWMGDDEDQAIQASAKVEVAASVTFAEGGPLPQLDDVYTDVLGTDWGARV